MHVSPTVRTLLEEMDALLERILALRSFPASRRDYAVEQRTRLHELRSGLIPAVYFRKGLTQLDYLRQQEHRTRAHVQRYIPREGTPEEQEEFWRQALAHEARVLECHTGYSQNNRSGWRGDVLSLAQRVVAHAREGDRATA